MVELTSDFIGRSVSQKRLLEEAELVAPHDTTVLITGESGTGKELLARFIHGRSSRRDGPYVTCDCAALSPSLLEAQLFGHRRGAFTGALADAPGYLESADRGTLFLDEVGELDPSSQTRLLRFLEDRTVVPLGDVASRRLDVRIVAATNRDLDRLLATGRFRDDLFFRLNVVNLRLEPLRDRLDDIMPLCEYYRRLHAVRLGKCVVGFTPQAREALLSWMWPGNVRELRNAIERAVVLSRGTWIDRADLPERMLGAAPAPPPAQGEVAAGRPYAGSFEEQTLAFQRRLLGETLAAVKGNRKEAAALLDLTPHQLKYLISKLGLAR